MIEKLNNLLQTKDKEWHDANNDLLLLSLMFDKEVDPLDKDFYRDMLGDELYNYTLSKDDKDVIVTRLKQFIDTNSSFASTAVGILGECNDDIIYRYLYVQLKDKYKLNPNLASSILRSLHGRMFDDFNKLLVDIKNDTGINNELRLEADRIYSSYKKRFQNEIPK
ncbi:MAG: hypothetical protein Ta2G_17760 [Termitinemataceae bacterium]|nr:MAG: hypothetical protein Ta2G_17760 [Termitinemataceae bacterium]